MKKNCKNALTNIKKEIILIVRLIYNKRFEFTILF